jgi:DNA primase
MTRGHKLNAAMADNFSDELKRQTDIVKIVGEYVKLRKTGAKNYTGLCPFHKEKTGSFSVNAVDGYFYCFGCHATGDIFTFVMRMDGLSFPEAVRAVATKAGVPLPKREFASPEEARDAGLRRQLIDLHEGAAQYFEAQLKAPGAARAREYLTGRGVTAETIQKFRIGFAPDDFNDMRQRLEAHFNDDAMRASGLFTSSEKNDDGVPTGPLYARFRKRITFPIANEGGKVIAFTARALEATDDKGRDVAKYVNSPETALYSKGTVLFNLDKAKAGMRTNDFALLVEGQMDCISVYMAGVHNVVATSGTAFTESQVRLLSRFTKRALVNFDPDGAGSAAAERSIALLTEEGFEVKLITLEDGLDPDRFVRERGVQAYMAALRGAQRHSDFLIERARQLFPPRTAENKIKAMNFLLPHIRRLPHSLQRGEFVEDAAQKLGIDATEFRAELKQAAVRRQESVPAYRPTERASETERVLLRALVLPEGDPARAAAANALGEHPEWYEGFPAAGLFDALAQGVVPSNPLDAAPDDASRTMLAEILASTLEPTGGTFGSRGIEVLTPAARVQHALSQLELSALERHMRTLTQTLAQAERRADADEVERVIVERAGIERRLREVARKFA